MAAMGLVGLRITRGWHGQVAAPCSPRSNRPLFLSLSFSVPPVCLSRPDAIRPISVPPHLSLFINRKEISRSKIALRKRRARGITRDTRGKGAIVAAAQNRMMR